MSQTPSMEPSQASVLSQQSSRLFSVNMNKSNSVRRTLGAKRSSTLSQRSVGLSRKSTLRMGCGGAVNRRIESIRDRERHSSVWESDTVVKCERGCRGIKGRSGGKRGGGVIANKRVVNVYKERNGSVSIFKRGSAGVFKGDEVIVFQRRNIIVSKGREVSTIKRREASAFKRNDITPKRKAINTRQGKTKKQIHSIPKASEERGTVPRVWQHALGGRSGRSRQFGDVLPEQRSPSPHLARSG